MVREAAERELDSLDAGGSSLGQAVLVLADQLDDPHTSATAKSMCAKALADLLEKVREVARQSPVEDGVDQLAGRRAKRRSTA
jgi:hypothetical protein